MDHADSSRSAWLGMAVRVIICDDQGRMLLLKRPHGGHFPDQWEFPGGKSDPGETPDISCVRETLEETGLQIRLDRLIGAVEGRVKGLRTINLAMAGSIVGGECKLSSEHVDASWCELDEIRRRDITDVTRDILRLGEPVKKAADDE